ncbi:hypothetical protein R9C00_17880 [Flammeovirgaceae bacterium SG7u.111]|nr:hypothetical protein [Flammeovirgaceae bacterium SG7u.132]WPO33574.1 hypothetical protein R9C00_17880 [Flammeovirgaceae bacterium SG7u.111]
MTKKYLFRWLFWTPISIALICAGIYFSIESLIARSKGVVLEAWATSGGIGVGMVVLGLAAFSQAMAYRFWHEFYKRKKRKHEAILRKKYLAAEPDRFKDEKLLDEDEL